jgi:hypothetical protein
MGNWREFKAVVAIGLDSKFAVVELSSGDEQALSMVSDDISEGDWIDCVGANTEVPGLYLVTAKVNLNSEEAPEYSDTVQALVRYTLPSNAA